MITTSKPVKSVIWILMLETILFHDRRIVMPARMNTRRMDAANPAPAAVRAGNRQEGSIHAAASVIVHATPVMRIDLPLDSLGNSWEIMIVAMTKSEKDAEKTLSA